MKARCGTNKFFRKIELSSYDMFEKRYREFYDISPGLNYIDFVLLEMVINQDATKMINERTATQLLDYFGDIGGF